MKPKICHMTSVHPANDIRIFYKQCLSLHQYGYDVHLVAQGTLPPDFKGVIHHVIPVPSGEGRLRRMIFRAWRAYRIAKATDAVIFHFHDPELLPYGLWLKWRGKIVIYDAHEDLPRDVLTKSWIPSFLRKPISWIVERMENSLSRRLDRVITATPHISQRFQAIGVHATDVKNYPCLTEFLVSSSITQHKPPFSVCYVGMISEERGMIEMIQAVEALDTRLIMAGPFINKKTELLARSLPGWKKVDYRGIVSRHEIAHIFNESIAGICIFRPSSAHHEALPNKLFEYMAASLPVLSSNFILWRTIVEQAKCGLCVDPLNVNEVRSSIEWMLQNSTDAKTMGQCGRHAVEENYTWEVEAEKLNAVYQTVLAQ